MSETLKGPRHVISINDETYPAGFRELSDPPNNLYLIGSPEALEPGLAVIGARRATPYGRGCAGRFARLAAEKGVVIISGGARGCDSEAHKAALAAHERTVAILGGGCDYIYPAEHFGLFQEIIDKGGAVLSEHPWSFPAQPFTFRLRNRLIAALAEAVLIVEAGLPSGTFSTADEALSLGKEVLVVPGSITSRTSRGSNRLLYQGALPVVDDESFEDILFSILGVLKRPAENERSDRWKCPPLIETVIAEPTSFEALYALAIKLYGEQKARSTLMRQLSEAEAQGKIARMPDGRWGPFVK